MKNYENYINEQRNIEYDINLDYNEIFVSKLKEKFPNEVKLYHITRTSNKDDILKNGLLIDKTSYGFIHTVLGVPNYGRLTSDKKGFMMLEITYYPDEYIKFFPEEETYLLDADYEYCEEYEGGDCRDNIIYKTYMYEHPDLIGGDITIYEDIPPSKIEIIDEN